MWIRSLVNPVLESCWYGGKVLVRAGELGQCLRCCKRVVSPSLTPLKHACTFPWAACGPRRGTACGRMVLTGAVYHITLGFHASGKCESLAIEVVMFLVLVWVDRFRHERLCL